jgi:RNA polymerase sigma factor (sigma-70 family)
VTDVRSGEADASLHERLVAGDDDALAEAYDRWSGLVYALAVDITGDRAAAEDVTQDVFGHLWELPEAYDPHRGSLGSWLCLVARSRALDWTSRRTPERHHAAAVATVDEQADIDETVTWRAEATVVREAVRALPAPQREAVLLAFYGGHSYREVANQLSIPVGTANSGLRQGLTALAERLATEGIIDR